MCGFFSGLFTSKIDLWTGMTDVHSHLLPGVDDGFSSLKASIEMLSFLEKTGVKRIFLTPHIMADLTQNREVFLRERFEALKADCADSRVELRLAAEYMLDECFYERMDEGLLSYDGRHVLVEVSCLQAPTDLFDKLYNIQLNGFIPVLAHPERYGYFSADTLLKLKELGCRFQLNIFSLSGFYGSAVRHNAFWLLKNGHYDFAGSDIHSLNYQSLYLNYKLKKEQAVLLADLLKRNGELASSTL